CLDFAVSAVAAEHTAVWRTWQNNVASGVYCLLRKVGQTSDGALIRPQLQTGLVFRLWASIRHVTGHACGSAWVRQRWGQRGIGDLDFVANRFTLLGTNPVDERIDVAVRAQVRRNNPQGSAWDSVRSVELARKFLTGLAHA